MRSVNFDNPYLLLLAIPLLIAVIIPFVIAIRKENRQKSAVISLAIHLVIVVLVTLAAAGAMITTILTKTTVYVVADVSYSSERELDLIDDYIEEIEKNLPRKTELGVVCFGKDSAVLYKPGEERKSVKDALVDNTATDIVSAIQYTQGLYEEGVVKKMVLITDAKSTDSNARGKLISQMETLEQQKIALSAIFVDATLEDGEREVQISDVDAVKKTFIGTESVSKVLVQASYEGQIKLTMLVKAPGSEEYVAEPYTIESITYGYNMFTLPLKTENEGLYEYKVLVEPTDDICSFNNEYFFTQEVDGQIDILLVTGQKADVDALTAVYGERATITSVIAKAGSQVKGLPYTVEELTAYDEIILSNVDIRELPNVSSFLNAVEISVSQFGKTLTTMGNLNIQNRADESLGDLGEMLSVNYGNSNSDTKMYTLVLDTSHSMNQAYKLKATKDAAKSLLSLLSDDDMVCVVSFSGDIETTQPPVRLGDKRNEINKLIDDLKPSQGTYIGTALNRALSIMKGYNYKEKQVMLISDGKTNDYDLDPLSVARTMKIYNIVTSTINVATVDDKPKTLLENIASITGGSSHFLADPESAGDFVFEDIADEVTEFIIEADSPVHIENPKDKLILGYKGEADDILSVPNIQGFVQTNLKTGSTLVLSVDYVKNEETIRVPLYSWREYGNGKVATLATSPSGAWLSSWDDEFKSLIFDNMLSSHLPTEKNDKPYELTVDYNGSYLSVIIKPASLRSDATAELVIKTPRGEEIKADLIFDSQKYYYNYLASEIGRYDINIVYKYDEKPEGVSQNAYFNLSYYPEYNMFASYSASNLHAFVDGEVAEGKAVTVKSDEGELATYEYRFTVPFLIIAMVLYVIDIAIRVLRFKKKSKKHQKTGKEKKV